MTTTTLEPSSPTLVAGLKKSALWPAVDIVTVFYNGANHIDAYFEAIKAMDYPLDRIHLYLIDNASNDWTAKKLSAKFHGSGLSYTLIPLSLNIGFTGGCNVALRAGLAEYALLLNPDAQIAPDALRLLVERAMREPGVGIIEAAQQPVEHPKWFNPKTGETPWCSGAAQLVRRRSIERAGVFDEHFFMYVEDVDLSWRMWAKGYRCIYEPRAKVTHAQGIRSIKGGQREFYLGMRNGLMMRLLYGGWRTYLAHIARMLKLALIDRHPDMASRKLVLRAIVAHTKHLSHLMRRRRDLRISEPHWAIKFYGWDYHPLRQHVTAQEARS